MKASLDCYSSTVVAAWGNARADHLDTRDTCVESCEGTWRPDQEPHETSTMLTHIRSRQQVGRGSGGEQKWKSGDGTRGGCGERGRARDCVWSGTTAATPSQQHQHGGRGTWCREDGSAAVLESPARLRPRRDGACPNSLPKLGGQLLRHSIHSPLLSTRLHPISRHLPFCENHPQI